ncbi:MAG: hypothetical protein ACK4M3_05355, partial [Pyrobaculum sp.]
VVALMAALTIDDLRKRQNPVFAGVQIESGKPNMAYPGAYCSAGFPVMYSASGGSLGLITASHCTDPYYPAYLVYQPYYDRFARDYNYAGFTDDRGTNDAYHETDTSKPDAAVWWVANRQVSNQVPVGLCGWGTDWARIAGYATSTYENGVKVIKAGGGLWKIGKETGCTGSSVSRTLIHDPRFAGDVYTIEYNYLPAQEGDSGGIVFTQNNQGNVVVVGTIVGGIPPGGSWQYVLVQSAEYTLSYYNVYLYK